MKQSKTMVCILVVLWFLCGCQSVFNPYDDAFQCPEGDEGTCTSISNAYHQSISGKPMDDGCTQCPEQPDNLPGETSPPKDFEQTHLRKKFETLHSLIEPDQPPMVVLPEVARILLLSYTGTDQEMYGFRYIYFFATEPSWRLSTATEEDQGGN